MKKNIQWPEKKNCGSCEDEWMNCGCSDFNQARDACIAAYAKAEGQELVPLGYSAISKWLISEFGFENEYIIRQLCEKFGQPKPNIPSVEELTYHITKFFYEFECESNIVYSKDLAKAIHALIVEKVEK